MDKRKITIAEFLNQCRLRIINSIEDRTIKQTVAHFGYTSERLEQGLTLLDTSTVLCDTYDKEFGDLSAVFEQRIKEQVIAEQQYKKHQAIARVALKDKAAAVVTLQLNARTPRTLSGWINQSRSFYNNLLENKQWLDAMAKFTISKQQLKQGLNLIKNVESYAEVIMREKGDAQDATIKRDIKLEELSEWVDDYESIAKLALHDLPQLLKKLGITKKKK